ncbi:GNAT family N-acetyltransferase [Saccharopolyspora phatthalungensis]|uniref:Putative N-acyltransferase n=1 Tax=Saccharopolyspora phatthalungensis TaxID=664693 RepID=A0A840QJD1_9PSEU|nr:GNAT family N-acetyltransferase [Saccharopolyspora phatthalungensis]MBB5157843.1 putative N-acyltransferase [Saccharopolyspora phatthalungensis]
MAGAWEVIDSIDRVDAEEWNRVVALSGGSVFHTHEWLRSYETAPPAPLFAVRHLLWRRDGELRAVAPMYEVAEDPHYTGYGPDYGFDHPILHTRMLVGHSWYSYFNGICSLDPAPVVAPGLVATMGEVAESLDTPLYGFPGVPEGDALGPELAARGFTPMYTEAASGVDFAGTAEAHIARLRPKVRREFGRLVRRSESLGTRVEFAADPDHLNRFAKLVEDVCARHGVPSINPPESLRSIFEHLRDHVHFTTVWKDDRLLGGFVLLHHESTLYAWIAGLDYEHHKEYGTYHVLYAHTLRLAERLGVRRIEMGRSMYGFKVRMGFHPRLLVSWFRSGTERGRELLADGSAVLSAAVRTRERIAEAYLADKAAPPAEFVGAPRFRAEAGLCM